MSTVSLMPLFKFDQADLRANQDGRLSHNQQAKWVEAGQWSQSAWQTTVSLGIALLIAIVGIIASVIVGQVVRGILLTLLVALLVGGGLWWWMRRNGRTTPEQAIPAVGRAEGIAHLREIRDESEGHVSHLYRLEIEHHTFQLFNKQQFEALQNGARYAVYYLDNDEKWIVSLEKLN